MSSTKGEENRYRAVGRRRRACEAGADAMAASRSSRGNRPSAVPPDHIGGDAFGFQAIDDQPPAQQVPGGDVGAAIIHLEEGLPAMAIGKRQVINPHVAAVKMQFLPLVVGDQAPAGGGVANDDGKHDLRGKGQARSPAR